MDTIFEESFEWNKFKRILLFMRYQSKISIIWWWSWR